MQKFSVTLEVTVNAMEDISVADLQEELEEALPQEFSGGTIALKEIKEV